MDLNRSGNEVVRRVISICSKKGVSVINNYSCGNDSKYPGSKSLYFVLKYNELTKKIRVSDHTNQHKNVQNQRSLSSITVKPKTKMEDVERFVSKKVEELIRSNLYINLYKLRIEA